MNKCNTCKKARNCSVLNRIREIPCKDYIKKNKKIAPPPTKAKCYSNQTPKGISTLNSNRK